MTWSVPPEWKGERCFVIAGGASVREQEKYIPFLDGRIIAIKQSVALRPDAEVMFIAGKDDPKVCLPFFSMHRGKYLIGRGPYIGAPPTMKVLRRDIERPNRLSHAPTHLAGYDAGTSAINLAYLFGATEIILLGYDMTGGRWFQGRYDHHLPFPPKEHFELHMAALPTFAEDLKAAGVRVINCSTVSRVKVFERRRLEDFV